jgi:hypothetical protein
VIIIDTSNGALYPTEIEAYGIMPIENDQHGNEQRYQDKEERFSEVLFLFKNENRQNEKGNKEPGLCYEKLDGIKKLLGESYSDNKPDKLQDNNNSEDIPYPPSWHQIRLAGPHDDKDEQKEPHHRFIGQGCR